MYMNRSSTPVFEMSDNGSEVGSVYDRPIALPKVKCKIMNWKKFVLRKNIVVFTCSNNETTL